MRELLLHFNKGTVCAKDRSALGQFPNPHPTMKLKVFIMALSAAGLGASLTSCVDPYYAGGPSHTPYAPIYRPGYEVRSLPPGYRVEVISGTRYYYHNNIYYRNRGNSYVVVESPRRGPVPPNRYDDRRGPGGWRGTDYRRDGDGYGNRHVMRELPRGAQQVTYRGQRYYRSGGVYYQSRSDGYVVVRSPY